MSEGPSARAAATQPLLVCMQCGFTHTEFRTRGLLGCPACFDHFGAALRADMLHIHPQLYRTPTSPEITSATSEDAAALREQLSDALRHERYEDAAALRQRIDAHAHTGLAQGKQTPTNSVAHRVKPISPHITDEALGAVPDAASFALAPVPWAQTQLSDTSSHLLFVRVTARRNFAGFPFWVSSAPEVCARVSETFRAAAQARGFGVGFHLADASRETIHVLRERMLLPERPASFPGKRDFKLWLPGQEPGEHLLFGETEHWTHTRLALPPAQNHPGDNTPHHPALSLNAPRSFDPFARATEIAQEWAHDTNDSLFAHSETWGYLTSHPAHAGPGLQVDAGIHLPALTALRRIPQIVQAMAAIGCELQPLSLREPGAAESGFFRLLTRGGLGLDAIEIITRFRSQVEAVLHAEQRARDYLTRDDRAQHELEDRAHRALNLLQEARRMESPELQLLVSQVRTGVYEGLFPNTLLPQLETLRVLAGPGHIAIRHWGTQGEPKEREGGSSGDLLDEARLRAALARHLLSEG